MDKLPVNSFQQALGGSLSRRAALVRLAGGAVAATLAIAGRGAIRGASPLAAPLDDQLAWVLATLNDGASSLTVAEVTERFDPEFLAAVPPDLLAGITQQIATAFAPVSLDGFTRPPTATQVNALLTSGNGTPLTVPVAVETAPPYRITGLTYAPVPPPSGVPLKATFGLDATPAAVPERLDGLFDIGGDRRYLSCFGAGSPTVLLESGANDPAAPWFAIETAVAAFARVCSYDRANTAGGASDPAAKPRTSRDMVADLHALLAEVGEAGPYVVVGHSAGALNGRLYASTYPDEVAGMVLIDPSHEEQNVQRQALLSPEHWAIYQQMNLDIEGIDLDASFAQVKDARAAAPLRSIPLVVMTAGQGADPALLPPGWPVEEDEQLWHDLHADLAELVPNARHVVADQSGHYIHQSQPDLVVESIRSVVDAVRDPDSWATPDAGATPASGG